ncbi:hypothetical protein HZA97_08585 [Candidatus Woesearchaeota archaeon]|nr:hypothetical protein [Candidatus Woesearchaeota archaeon]
MVVTREQVKTLAERLCEDWDLNRTKEPFIYFVGVGYCTLKFELEHNYSHILLKNPLKDDEGKITLRSPIKIFKQPKIKLNEKDSLDDWCLTVNLLQKPPKNVKLIDEYGGAKVVYRITGMARLC